MTLCNQQFGRAVTIAAWSFLVGCGGQARVQNTAAEMQDAHETESDAALASDAGSADTGSASDTALASDTQAGESDASSDMDASTACDDLADAAATEFGPIVQQNLACSVDTDCVWTASDPGGWCVAACGALTNEAGVGAVQSAANRLCQPFLAQGCTAPALGCPYLGPFICAGGTCASYHFYLTPYPLPTLTHGVCSVLTLNYGPSGGSPDAPRDLAVSMSASNGTLYSDPACTIPLTTSFLTISSGSSDVAFGFTPTAPGACLLEIGPEDLTYSLTAQ